MATIPADVDAHAPIAAVAWVERAERHEIHASGLLETPTRQAVHVSVVNLSRSGCLVTADVELEIGAPVSISLMGVGTRSAVVRRVSGNAYGCAFDELLRPTDVMRAIEAPRDTCEANISRRLRTNLTAARAEEVAESAWSRIRRRMRRPAS